MGDNLSTVRVAFTVDLTPYVAGLKTMMSMTSAVGQQLTPLLNLKAKADTKILDAQLKALQKSTDDYINSQVAATGAQGQASVSTDNLAASTGKSSKATNVHAESMRGVKRDALQMFGAISFLGIGIIQLTGAIGGNNEKLQKLSQGMNQGISAGFGLASMIMMVGGAAAGPYAVAIGIAVTAGMTLLSFFSDAEERAKRAALANDAFARSIAGARNAELDALVATLNNTISKRKAAFDELSGFSERKAEKQGIEQLEAYRDQVQQARIGKEKNYAAVREMLRQAEVVSTLDQFEKQRVEARQVLDRELDDYSNSEKAKTAARQKYSGQLKVIALQEADWNQQLADTQFETELSKIRTHGIQLGVEQSTIDLQIIEARKQHYQKQLDNLDSLVMSERERTKRRADLEKTLTGVVEEEVAKRKQIEDAHQAWLDKRSEYSYQKALAELQLYALQHGYIQEKITVTATDWAKKYAQGELQINESLHDAGKVSDADYLTRKQQLLAALAKLDVDYYNTAKALIDLEKDQRSQAIQGTADNMANAFQTLAGIQTQATSEQMRKEQTSRQGALDAELKAKQKSLDAEKQRRLATARTEAERTAIENEFTNRREKLDAEYAAKKTALDEQLQAKARDMNKQAFEIQKAFAIVQATISTYEAAAKALTAAPPPFNYILMGSVIAAGLAQVAAIESQTVPGFAEGGRLPKGKTGYFEGYRDELVAPESDFKQIMRAEIIPIIRLDLQRQEQKSAVSNLMERTQTTNLMSDGETKDLLRKIDARLENLHIEFKLEGRAIKAVLNAQNKFDARKGLNKISG
jgi:hypothetical protein